MLGYGNKQKTQPTCSSLVSSFFVCLLLAHALCFGLLLLLLTPATTMQCGCCPVNHKQLDEELWQCTDPSAVVMI